MNTQRTDGHASTHGGDDVTPVKAAGGHDSQGIFAERFDLFTDALGATCEQENVKTAIVIIDDPKLPGKPIALVRGEQYDAARLMTWLLRRLRSSIISEITP